MNDATKEAERRERYRTKARWIGSQVANAIGLESYIEVIDGKEHRHYYTPGNGKGTSVGALCLGLAVMGIVEDVESELK